MVNKKISHARVAHVGWGGRLGGNPSLRRHSRLLHFLPRPIGGHRQAKPDWPTQW
jgi:hypothetical protein